MSSTMHNVTYNRTTFLSMFEQRFITDQSERDVLHEDKYWKRSIPHEYSGPCETYDPPFESDPGYEISMYMRMNSSNWDPNLDIYIHEKNKFFFSKKHMTYLSPEELRSEQNQLSHPRGKGNIKILISVKDFN